MIAQSVSEVVVQAATRYCAPVQELQVVHIEIPPELPPGVRKLDPAIQVPQELPEAPLRLRLLQVSQLEPDR